MHQCGVLVYGDAYCVARESVETLKVRAKHAETKHQFISAIKSK
jgi:hypothetical protein